MVTVTKLAQLSERPYSSNWQLCSTAGDSKEDIYWKLTHLKRAIGDSRQNDSALWSAGVTGGVSHVVGSSSATSKYASSTFHPPVITQAIHRKHKPFIYFQTGELSDSPPIF